MTDVTASPKRRDRAHYLPAPHAFNLNMACIPVAQAFDGFGCYLVGSALERRDYRDVDVRCIVSDEEWARLFPGATPNAGQLHPLWSILCASISLYLSQHTGLPVDFQVQQQTHASETFPKGMRHPLGLLLAAKPTEHGEGT